MGVMGVMGVSATGTVTIQTQGRAYQILGGLTAIQALWAAGVEVVHGVGCLGGTCGACTMTFRRHSHPPADQQAQGYQQAWIGLGCQTLVEDGLAFEFLQPVVAPKPTYRLTRPDHADGHSDPQAGLLQHFPEAARCRVCRACTQACPQGIDVMSGVLAAAKGNLATTADAFFNCVMCGACAAVCVGVADIRPHEVGLYARRAHGVLELSPPANLVHRLEEIAMGVFEAEWTQHRNLTATG